MPNGLYAINDRGLNDAMQRRWFIRDDVGMSLMPELAAVVNIDQEAELQYLLGWRTWSVSFGFAALAANGMQLQFQNPNLSNAIIVLEEITAASGSAGDSISIGFPGTQNNASLTTAIPVHGIMDGRMKQQIGAAPGGLASISTKQAAAAFTIVGANAKCYLLTTNVSFTVPLVRPYVLVPGTTILMGFAGVNAQQLISLTWRERMLNDQENST